MLAGHSGQAARGGEAQSVKRDGLCIPEMEASLHSTLAFLLVPNRSIAFSSSVLHKLSAASRHDRAALLGAILFMQHPMIQEWRKRRGLRALTKEGHPGAASGFWARSSAVCTAGSLHALLGGGASRAGAGDTANCGACFAIKIPGYKLL